MILFLPSNSKSICTTRWWWVWVVNTFIVHKINDIKNLFLVYPFSVQTSDMWYICIGSWALDLGLVLSERPKQTLNSEYIQTKPPRSKIFHTAHLEAKSAAQLSRSDLIVVTGRPGTLHFFFVSLGQGLFFSRLYQKMGFVFCQKISAVNGSTRSSS